MNTRLIKNNKKLMEEIELIKKENEFYKTFNTCLINKIEKLMKEEKDFKGLDTGFMGITFISSQLCITRFN